MDKPLILKNYRSHLCPVGTELVEGQFLEVPLNKCNLQKAGLCFIIAAKNTSRKPL
jgi:hypothetical protein